MGNHPLLTAVICDDDGNRLPNIPPLGVKSAALSLTSWDDFPASHATFGADEKANISLIVAMNGIKFYERGVGLISWHTIEDPTLLIQDTGDEIQLTLPNITDQMSRHSTGLSASYATALSSIVAQVGAIGETVEWQTFYDSDNKIDGFFAFMPDGTYVYDTSGKVTKIVTPGTGKFSPWSATMADDGTYCLSVQAASWGVSGTVTSTNNFLGKLTTAAFAYDSIAFTDQQIGQAVDSLGNPLNSPGAFSFQAADISTQLVAGIGHVASGTPSDVTHGFELLASPTPQSANATGTWNFWVAGSRVVVGQQFAPGDTFALTADYTSGTPRIVFAHNGTPVNAINGLALPYRGIAFIATPGGQMNNAVLSTTTRTKDQNYLITFNQQTPLAALVQLATATDFHLRQQVDAAGAPIRALEFGTFGEQSGVRLTGGYRTNLARSLSNPNVRLVTALNWKQESAKVINTISPLGASVGSAQVDLARCWSILNDPGYENYYAKYGSFANIFPEYDEARYPIRRTLNKNGTWEYYVRDKAAYTEAGFEVRGAYSDPQFQYDPTTASVASQELIARALYVATTTKLRWESQINHTLAVSTARGRRPPRAGSRVYMDFKRIAADASVGGNFTVMSSSAQAKLSNPYVAGVVRNYNNDGSTSDDYTLSYLPRNPQEAVDGTQSALRQLEAIKIVQQNTTVYLPVYGDMDVDANPNADHSCIAEIRVPVDVFRITSAPLDVQFSPLRQQTTTTKNSDATIIISIPTEDIIISSVHGDHTIAPLTGGAYDAAKGFATSQDEIGGMPLHFHQIPIYAAGGTFTPTASQDDGSHTSKWTYVFSAGNVFRLTANNSGPGILETNGQMVRASAPGAIDLTPSQHVHNAPIDKAVGVSTLLTGTVVAQTVTAPLPLHTHDLDTNLNDVHAPSQVELDIDPGTGQWLPVLDVGDAISGAFAVWTASFYLPDVSKYVTHSAGKLVRIRARSLTDSLNGVGHIRIQGIWKVEIGGIGTSVFTA